MRTAARFDPCTSGVGSSTFRGMVDGTDWAARYRSGDTPWDLGGPHPELSARLQGERLLPPRPGATAFVPGAGAGHDALALARRGWAVTAVDLVEALAPRVGPDLERKGGRFVIGDAIEFEAEAAFDLVWDHTFFCAIQPGRREAWGRRVGALLAPGGVYAALVFPVGKPASEGGPPFGMEETHVREVLGPRFRVEECAPVSRAVSRRTWREHWLAATRTHLEAH